MFNWFGRKYKIPERYPTWADIPNPPGLPEPNVYPDMPEVKETNKEVDDDGYTIGPGSDGFCTMMRIKSGYSTMTLQLSEDGTRQMIKLLEAMLPEEQ